MPEQTVVPRGRTIRPVALPPGALEDIRARAHRRRAGRAALVGSAGLTAVVLVAVAVLAGGLSTHRDDSLRIVPADPVVDLLPVEPAPRPTPGAPLDEAPAGPDAAAPEVGAAVVAPRPAGVGAQPQQQVEPAAPPAEAPDAGSEQRRYDPDAVRTNDGIIVLLPECEQAGRGSVDGWCLSALADTGNRRLVLTTCRARGAGPGRLDFPTSKQVHFDVRNAAGRLVWSYDPRVRPEPESVEVSAEGCLGWEVPYGVVDEQDQPLPDGTYTAYASSTASTLRGSYRESTFYVGADQPIQSDARGARPKVPSIG